MRKLHISSKGEYRPGLHRFCLLLSLSTLLLVVAGGMVTSTDSGLAVPDWPLSYGQLMPPMVGGIFYEHGHRMVATFVGFLTTILAIAFWKMEKRRWVRNLGLIALVAVVSQGVLGGLTVIYLLPTWISVSHATLAQLFFSLTVFFVLITSGWWIGTKAYESANASATRQFGVLTAAAVLLQLVFGALMRHTGSGLAVPDFPFAYGELWPSIDPASLASMNETRAELDLLPVAGIQVGIHMLHRLWAVVVTVLVVLLARHTFRVHAQNTRLREISLLMLVLTGFQILLGALTVWTGKNPYAATAHVATGALILAGSVSYVSMAIRLLKPKVTHHVADFAPERSIP